MRIIHQATRGITLRFEFRKPAPKLKTISVLFKTTEKMNYLLYILTIFFLTSCSGRIEKKLDNPQVETIPDMALWADDYIIKYLENNKDRLTEVDGYPVTYIKETTERNQRNYAMVRIGHNFESRYVTDQWIFVDSLTKEIYEYDLVNDSLILWKGFSSTDDESNEILANGKYRFDIAFAEWEGKSIGEKVTVVINGKSIKVIYEGDGQLTLAKKGEIIDEGEIMKHKTGVWIIGKHTSDKQLDEIGGCSDGPAIIDFKNKKYWMC